MSVSDIGTQTLVIMFSFIHYFKLSVLVQIIGVVFRVSVLHRGDNVMVSFDPRSLSYLVP